MLSRLFLERLCQLEDLREFCDSFRLHGYFSHFLWNEHTNKYPTKRLKDGG